MCATSQAFDLPTISANIVYQDTGEPVTASHKIIPFDSFKVGVTGIVAKQYEETILSSNQINGRSTMVIEERPALTAQLSALRDEVEILILLAHVGFDQCRSIAEQEAAIDVIICGNGDRITEEPLLINEVVVVQAGNEGQKLRI